MRKTDHRRKRTELLLSCNVDVTTYSSKLIEISNRLLERSTKTTIPSITNDQKA